jgi:hypothetical protein
MKEPYSTDHELEVGVVVSNGSDLNDGTDDHNDASAHDHLSSTEVLSEEVGEDGAEEASDLVDLKRKQRGHALARGDRRKMP